MTDEWFPSRFQVDPALIRQIRELHALQEAEIRRKFMIPDEVVAFSSCVGEHNTTVLLPVDGPLPAFGQVVCHHKRRWWRHLWRRSQYFWPPHPNR